MPEKTVMLKSCCLCVMLLQLQLRPHALAATENSCAAYAGVPGIPGHNGTPGRDGKDGVAGQKGQKGDPGLFNDNMINPFLTAGIGAQGPPGKMGPTGPTGPKGDKGGLPAMDASDKIIKNLQSEVKHLTDTLNGIEKASRFRTFKNVGGKYYVSNGLEANFGDGVKFCTDVGGKMVLPTNEDENTLLSSMHAVLGSTYILIGITDEESEGTFVDLDNRPLSFTKWKKNEPNNYRGAENCAVVYSDGEWYDVTCDSKWHVVCELHN
ncbi:mannan-binding lectin [Triplophysa rosa]|uniref:Mannan-binding lectin n=1 Tax=Triplophysa rosa TaxID=992332 RepID=A0A9W7WVW0_TRIRA|nr:mannan-binding lectin [Triplophysa rosa]